MTKRAFNVVLCVSLFGIGAEVAAARTPPTEPGSIERLRRSNHQPSGESHPFTATNILTLTAWASQEDTWPERYRRWLPSVPPLPCPFAIGDFDLDGHPDIVLGETAAGGRLFMLSGNGKGNFSEAPLDFDDGGSPWSPLTAIVPVDIDADRDLDLYLVRWGRNEVLVNDGHGRFAEWAAVGRPALGLEDEGYGGAAAFFDADRDGDLDLVVGNVAGGGGFPAGSGCKFYRNRDGVFEEETEASGLAGAGRTISLCVQDVDLDVDEDLLVVNYMGPSRIYLNSGTGSFSAVRTDSSALVNLGCDGADLNADLRPDLLVAAVGHPGERLERSRITFLLGDGGVHDLELGLHRFMMCALPRFCDFDNDGNTDLVFGRATPADTYGKADAFASWVSLERDADGLLAPGFPSRDVKEGSKTGPGAPWLLLRNLGSGWLEEADLGRMARSCRPARGVAWFDADTDGRPDLLVFEVSGQVTLLLNQIEGASHSATVTVRAGTSNTMGLGAQVFLRTDRTIRTGWVKPGRSDHRAAEGWVHFGLGKEELLELAVRWPGGGWQRSRPPAGKSGEAVKIGITEDAGSIQKDPPSWLAPFLAQGSTSEAGARSRTHATTPVSECEDAVFRLERALMADPTRFDLGAEYRTSCLARGLLSRCISFFEEHDSQTAPFAWTLHRVLAYVELLRQPDVEIGDLAHYAGLSVFELELLNLPNPQTWLVNYLLGTNLLHWPPLFEQTQRAIETLQVCIELQGDRRDAHLAAAYVGLGDGYGLLEDTTTARSVWRRGAEAFPEDPELQRRLELDAEEINGFCLVERDVSRVPSTDLPWLEAESPHSPLSAERRAVEASPGDPERGAGGPAARSSNLWDAQRSLDEALSAADGQTGRLSECLAGLESVSLRDAWPHLRRGYAYIDFGFLRSHLEAADRELDLYCRRILDSVSDPEDANVENTGWESPLRSSADREEQDETKRRLFTVGILGRGDTAMMLGDRREALRLYTLAKDLAVGSFDVRLREVLTGSAAREALWLGRFRGLPRCGEGVPSVRDRRLGGSSR